MATVYLAEELHPRRKVAIKIMSPELAGDILRERFIREVEMVSTLTHPHIVPVFSAGDVDGMLYYVMPFIDGSSLRQPLIEKSLTSIDDVLRIAAEIGGALEYAHNRGIVHRDIKPENVLFAGGHALVADFGIARGVGGVGTNITMPGAPIGTPLYMAPEQWAGSGEIDGRAEGDVGEVGRFVFGDHAVAVKIDKRSSN